MKDGMQIVTLSSWKYFADFINQELLDYRTYIYRGHASDDWKLESTLDRNLKRVPTTRRRQARGRHLRGFQYAVRGRRGPNPARMETDNDWWALGQHNGLATPLLDWTESPYVALYFAFQHEDTDGSGHRVVWGVSQGSISRASQLILDQDEKERAEQSTEMARVPRPRPSVCEVIRPLTDENARLVNQRGLFVRGPDGVPLDSWIKEQYADDEETWHIFKLRIPDTDRARCLRVLNRMNINHLSLFPDLFGASEFCNMELIIKDY